MRKAAVVFFKCMDTGKGSADSLLDPVFKITRTSSFLNWTCWIEFAIQKNIEIISPKDS